MGLSLLITSMAAGGKRKALGVKFPNQYASDVTAEKDEKAMKFNYAQRGAMNPHVSPNITFFHSIPQRAFLIFLFFLSFSLSRSLTQLLCLDLFLEDLPFPWWLVVLALHLDSEHLPTIMAISSIQTRDTATEVDC